MDEVVDIDTTQVKRYAGYASGGLLGLGIVFFITSVLLIVVGHRSRETKGTDYGLSVAGRVFGSIALVLSVALVGAGAAGLAVKDSVIDGFVDDNVPDATSIE